MANSICLARLNVLFLLMMFCASCGGASTDNGPDGPPIVEEMRELPVGTQGKMVTAHPAITVDGVGYRLYEQINQSDDLNPLVIYIGGSEGGFSTNEADVPAALLRAGFSVATIGYFDFSGGPPILSEINATAVQKHIKHLAQSYENGDACVGIVGVSKGAELTLMLASRGKLADAYVANVPSSVVWQASNVTLKSRSSWLVDGRPVPFLRYPMISKAALDIFRGGDDFRAVHDAGLKRKRAAEKAVISIERIREPVLLMSARQDHVWPSYEMSIAMMERLDAIGNSHKFQHTDYDLNHFLFDHSEVIQDAISFLDSEFSKNASCSQ